MKKLSHKKIIIIIACVILVLIISLVACGGKMNEKAKTDALKASVTANKDKDKVKDKGGDETQEESDKAKEDAAVDTEPMPTETPADTPATQPTEKPTSHTHNWKEHHATKQVWVSNIVPIYETQKVQTGTHKVSDGWYWHCNCGAVIPISQYEDHAVAHIEADEPDNGYEKEHFHDEPVYEEKQVQVGTKDEGHYETQTYVDYYYCDCGARQ